MTDAAVQQLFIAEPKSVRDKWTAINNNLLKRSKKRNKLAHGSLIWSGQPPEFSFAPYYFSTHGIKITPTDDPADPFQMTTLPRLGLSEIEEIAQGFDRIRKRLTDLLPSIERIAMR